MDKIKELDHIIVTGAKEHNLKDIHVEIPKKKLVVITGVSGSGKSSLAFDTLFAEGQRRYVESLSSYARRFLGQMEKPKFETIRGLAPTIAIEQKAASKNPRSTVGTITEIYDYLRVLFARVGVQYCHICGKKVGRGDASQMVEQLTGLAEGTKILLLAPIVENRKGEHKEHFEELRQKGFMRVRIDGVVRELADVQSLAKHKKHNIEVVVDRLIIKGDKNFKKRITDSVELSLKLGQGQLVVHVEGREDLKMSEARSCCGFAFPELDPPLFSFNSPLGMCPECHGIGSMINVDEAKVIPDSSLSIREGALVPWSHLFEDGEEKEGHWGLDKVKAMEKQWGIDLDTSWKGMSKKHRDWILYGSSLVDRKGRKGDLPTALTVEWKGGRGSGKWSIDYEGLIPGLMRRYRQSTTEGQKSWFEKFMSTQKCPSCEGRRLKPDVLAVKISNKSIMDLCSLTISDAHQFFSRLELTGNQKMIASELLKEIKSRLGFLVNVGLNYLNLGRMGPSLSGGEAQRIRLASQIGSELTGVLYILDEPSIGLHQRDNKKLLDTLCHLRDIGNTLVVVEHDQETIEAADWVLDMGPGAGHLGGQVVAAGTPDFLRSHPVSLTGKYLRGEESIAVPAKGERRAPAAVGQKWLKIIGANSNNLSTVNAEIPLGLLTCVTGVSGAGKSTLINQILYPALSNFLHKSQLEVGQFKKLEGTEHFDKVINIDQKPIGRTPRSNPATYTKVFDLIRDVFASLPESKVRGYSKGRFSFNVKGGRCEQCQGDGHILVEMHFLADVMVPCEVCRGKRFNSSTLEVEYKGQSIAAVLELSVAQAREHFARYPKIVRILDTLMEVGLSYIKLGQSATTMSGGEAQRIKLARELAKRDTGKTLYILDEPTTGLHFDDIKKLLQVLVGLVKAGNTMVVIEHNLDVIKTADWIIDMGPEGGAAGGLVVAAGTPEQVAKVKESYTGQFLKKILKS